MRMLKEIDPNLSFAAVKACYLSWVRSPLRFLKLLLSLVCSSRMVSRSGNPLHFLHSAPLQFGAFEPLRLGGNAKTLAKT